MASANLKADDDTPHDVFETTPEEALLVSSDVERNAIVDGNVAGGIDDGGKGSKRRVNLGKDSDSEVGFSEVKSMNGVGERVSTWQMESTLTMNTEKFEYVGPTHPNLRKILCENIRGRRELPWSIRGQAANAVMKEKSVAATSSSPNPRWNGLRDVLKVLAERCEPDQSVQNATLLEIAKSRGMTFPPPISSQREGSDEK